MAIDDQATLTLEQDEQYHEALAKLQAGQWDDAIALLKTLQARYSGRSDLTEMLEQARLKASLDASGRRVRPRRFAFVWSPLLRRALLVISLAAIAFGAFLLYQVVIGPAIARTQHIATVRSLHRQAQEAMEQRDFATAESLYQEILALEPNDVIAADGVEAARRQKELDADYRSALALLDQGEKAKARELLVSIAERAPGYRDVARLLRETEEETKLAELLRAADADFEAERWGEAAEEYAELRRLNGAYEQEHVGERLFESYLNYGLSLVNTYPAQPEDLDKALLAFNKALSLRPREPQVTAERNRLRDYLEGKAAYEAGAWQMAIDRLRPIYDERPDYLGGALAEDLYRAYLALGDEYLREGERQLAFEQYQQAAHIAGVDTAEAEVRILGLAPGLTPTPTATPTPTSTPTPTPEG
ncbi:MAG TPA: hypothetical protein EYP04_00850, partial [Anaerolineae bacterium]|nr:hypothetical protein [Anaerolineae bacterium]